MGSGLALAVSCAALLDWLLLASFVWVELVDPSRLRLAWLAGGTAWIVLAAASAWHARALAGGGSKASEAMFREAISEYLRGSWFEAERILGRLLHARPRDVEARLMLATLLRRTGRHAAARDHLAQLELLRDAGRWSGEIGAEKRLIDAAMNDAATGAERLDATATTDTVSPTATPQAA